MNIDQSAIDYANGYLRAGHGGPFASAWNGLRYSGVPWFKRIILTVKLAHDLKVFQTEV